MLSYKYCVVFSVCLIVLTLTKCSNEGNLFEKYYNNHDFQYLTGLSMEQLLKMKKSINDLSDNFKQNSFHDSSVKENKSHSDNYESSNTGRSTLALPIISTINK